jgi:hypothetical protein
MEPSCSPHTIHALCQMKGDYGRSVPVCRSRSVTRLTVFIKGMMMECGESTCPIARDRTSSPDSKLATIGQVLSLLQRAIPLEGILPRQLTLQRFYNSAEGTSVTGQVTVADHRISYFRIVLGLVHTTASLIRRLPRLYNRRRWR